MRNRPGFSLVEVVVATLVFSVGALGLAATAASISKQIRANSLRSNAAFIARSRAERAFHGACFATSGEERAPGITSTWSMGGAAVASLDQQIDRFDSFGHHADRFLSVIACE